jgi:hypothetical protein
MIDVRIFGAGLIAAALVVTVAPVHAEGSTKDEVQLAALPMTPVDPTPTTDGPVIQVQTQTCGCTPAPNPKQKIMTNNSGKLTCTATTLACWAP